VQGAPLPRNPLALANVRFNVNNSFFWDERSSPLEATVLLPIQDPLELGMSLELLIPKLRATEFYPPLFERAFGSPELTPQRIASALAQFLRSMISYRAKFDAAMHPPNFADTPTPEAVFSLAELRGAELFKTLNCALCHQPNTHNTERTSNNGLLLAPGDIGAGRGRFRSASLRNIAQTGPYMHDGRFATLRQVIEHYNSGVQLSDDLPPPLKNATSSAAIRLNLTEADKAALEAFLHTLTDHEFLSDPKFSDPF
jgi:cytochrome c peroxidase